MPTIPPCTWQRPIGLGWTHPYRVRYGSNLDDGPWHGMPLGGMGAGCLGRSHGGEFNLWHLDGGEHTFQTMPACQFSVFEQQGDQTQAWALATTAPLGVLSTWQWYPASDHDRTTGTYHALYPRSWFTYSGILHTHLTCEQFSPVWKGNYQESSYPIALFEWTAHNPSSQPLTLSLLLTWENMVGWFTNAIKAPKVRVRDDGSPVYEYQPRLGESQGNFNQVVQQGDWVGCVLDRQRSGHPQEGDGQWAIATSRSVGCEVFCHSRWNPVGDGAEIWQEFHRTGAVLNVHDSTPAADDERIAVALTVRFTLQPHETRRIPFVVGWDLPVTEFAAGITYFRRYTDFFGREGQHAWSIACHALQHYPSWQQQIITWQQPILDRADLPSWFKMALFNELYDLTGGGTLWSSADADYPIGRFGILECIDYRWYESLDVRLYGGFAILQLFPDLEKAILRAFAQAIPAADATPRIIGYNSAAAIRKAAGATPHDLGAPNEHPWYQTNYTSYQDCNLWKDLPCDFVLQVYRAYLWQGKTDPAFLAECWPAIVATLTYLKTFDLDGDGIPENSGAPDQTFDDWRLQGVSAYCGGLWLAALEAAIAIAKILQQEKLSLPPEVSPSVWMATYQRWFHQSQPVYEQLWNGRYYRLDQGSGSDVVMADQLCGQFFARLLGLPDIVPEENIQTALQTIYQACFVHFNERLLSPDQPRLGVANGVRPDGSPENPQATHPLEIWTGINFGLATFFIQMGMKDKAMTIVQAVIHQIYTHGLQFRTPEAITAQQTFRACHYLRAMAIWGVYAQLEEGRTQ